MTENIKAIQTAIDFIETNLDEELTFNTIAKHVGISSSHFQRTFRAITGDTLKEYIRGRRLALAADKLVNTNERILDIAIFAGFESQEAFTRAFSNYFGRTPKKFRENNMGGVLVPPKIKFDENYIKLITKGEIVEPIIKTIPAKKLVGMATVFGGIRSKNPSEETNIPQLWQRFSKRIFVSNEITNRKGQSLYALVDCLPTDLHTDEDIFNTYFACTEVENFDSIPDGMRAVFLPESKYAVFKCPFNDISNSLKYIFSSWFPKSDYKRTKSQDLAIMIDSFNPNSENPMFEYCIPIK